MLIFIVNAVASFRKPKEMHADRPVGRADARVDVTSSPPPEYNFDEIPVVHALDELWHRKYAETRGRPASCRSPAGGSGEADDGAIRTASGHGGGHGIHMPAPSYFPLVARSASRSIGVRADLQLVARRRRRSSLLAGFYGWVLEPAAE